MEDGLMRHKRHLTVCSIVVLLALGQHTAGATGFRRPQSRSAALAPQAAAAGCQWTYYPVSGGRLQAEQPLYNDLDNTPIGSLAVGTPFKSNAASHASLATTGSIDFDADGKTDVLRTWPRSDGLLQWQFSSGGLGGWQDLGYAGTSLTASRMRFGEFDGDAVTDVFDNDFSVDIGPEWLYSSSGTENFFMLFPTPPSFLELVAVGDFNGDGHADIFTVVPTFTHDWSFYPGQGGLVGNAQVLAGAPTSPFLLRFGDFDGDGKTDVFAPQQLDDGTTQWMYSSGGAGGYTTLTAADIPSADLRFGDFDGDGVTDVLAVLPDGAGGETVRYYPRGLAPALTLGTIADPAPALRVGDFNGDGISDLLALRCGLTAPLTFRSRQILGNSGYQGFRSYSGDVDGDGRADVILVATCQKPEENGSCASHYLQIGAAQQTPGGTYQLKAPQLVDGTLSFRGYSVVVGDFNGDGKTDVALFTVSDSVLSVSIAHSNGDGSFTLGAAQSFGNESWELFNVIPGDFNGDGKTDLALATVCNFTTGSCTPGDTNRVYVATSTGSGFTLSGRQDLSAASGWGDYFAIPGDFNGDGKTDLVFNATCQSSDPTDTQCTRGDANLIYTALSNGFGGFTMSAKQIYGSSGWMDFFADDAVAGDLNHDGRSDLVWVADEGNTVVRAGLANPDGTFQIGPTQDFGSAFQGELTLADLNHDGKGDLFWDAVSSEAEDLYTYAAATSNGDGTFANLGQGAVYTGPGTFMLPKRHTATGLPAGVTVVSTVQDLVSNALVVVHGDLGTGCTGDCSGDGTVTIDELILGVGIALGSTPVSACSVLADAQGMVDIAQLVKAVSNALNGCTPS